MNLSFSLDCLLDVYSAYPGRRWYLFGLPFDRWHYMYDRRLRQVCATWRCLSVCLSVCHIMILRCEFAAGHCGRDTDCLAHRQQRIIDEKNMFYLFLLKFKKHVFRPPVTVVREDL